MARREYSLRKKYGLSLAAYYDLGNSQYWCCGICGGEILSDPKDGRRSGTVDHCHASGRVRGLLCTACNMGLGQFQDDPDILRRAIEYLAPWSEDREYVGLNS